MPLCRCDFHVFADLVLPAGRASFELKNFDGVTTTIRNAPPDAEGHATGLVASVVGPAESIHSAREQLRTILSQQLDLLTFVTHSRFKIVRPLRAIEWEPFQKSRQFRAFHTSDSRQPPAPELKQRFVEAAGALDAAKPPAFTRTALQYFRYGLIDDGPQDQFMRLWLALEIVAENVKEKLRVPIVCGKCGAALVCPGCGNEPTRVPMAKQAIEQLITKIAGASAAEACKRQFTARNGLMHGRSSESIEAECGVSMQALVDELGGITWHAIISTISSPPDGPPRAFGHWGGEFTNKTLITSMLGIFEHNGEGPHPPDDKIPNVEITLSTRFGDPDKA